MFGMKLASSRLTIANGEEHGYASYESWSESLMDYALYYSSYLRNVKTEREYYQFLSKFYAEDVEYVSKIQNLIKNEQLKSKFN
jgi:flagellum-specific peptidoglycan hydrolase FlgJ